MLKKRIIPAIDVINDKAAKYVQFRDPVIIGDPAELGKRYAEEGADEIIYLDTTASVEREEIKYEWIQRVAQEMYIPFTVIGGIQNLTDIRKVLRAGADKVGLNSAAVHQPNILKEAADTFGKQCIVLALDAKAKLDLEGKRVSWEIYTHSAHKNTGIDAIEWAKEAESLGAGEIVCTSINRDGMKNGYDTELMRMLTDAVSIPVIASGGAGNVHDIADVFLFGNVQAALVASLLHYDETTIGEIKEYLNERGIPIQQSEK